MKKTNDAFGAIRCFEGRKFQLLQVFSQQGAQWNKLRAEEKMILVRRRYRYARLVSSRHGEYAIYVLEHSTKEVT